MNRPHWADAHVLCDSAVAAAANVQADGLDGDRSEAAALLRDFREWLRDGHPLTLSADDWASWTRC